MAVCLLAMGVVTSGSLPGASAPKAYASTGTVALSVDAGNVVAPMSELMRGTNIGIWTHSSFNPVSNWTDRYVNLIKGAGISMIRFPAGGEADISYFDRTNSYQWHVGPAPYTRTLRADHLDSIAALAQEAGAELMITVNLRINNKEMAADIVRYANVEKGYNIKYWELGNEPEYFGAPYNLTPQQVAVRAMEYMDAMRAVDPSIQFIGAASGTSLKATWTKPIMTEMHQNNKPYDAISVHWYPLAGTQTNPNSSAYPSITNLLKYEGTNWQPSYINWVGKFMETDPENLVHYRNTYAPDALIGLTELGQVTGGNEGAGVGDTLAGALWQADVLGRLAYHQVDFVTQFLLQGNQAYALMNMNKEIRPSYYVYPLLKRYFGDQLVQTSSSDNQNFTIWATKKTGVTNKLYLMVINKNQTQDLSASIQLANFVPNASASTWVLNAPSVDSLTGANINGVQVAADGTLPAISGNSITGVSGNFTRTFPAHSITMIELTGSETPTENGAPARYLAKYANGINERKDATAYPGSVTNTPDGWGKIWMSGAASWTVNFPETGEYDYSIRAYGEGAAPKFQIKVDGQVVPNSSVSPVSSWNNYNGSLGTITAGTHTVTIHNNSAVSGNNVDVAHMDIIGAAPGTFALTAPADQSALASTAVTLNWTQQIAGKTFAPFGADSYTVIVADNAAFTMPIVNTTVTATTHEVNQLQPNTTYYWKVIANNANGSTASNAVFSFTTP